MKITMTITELTALVAARFQLPSDAVLEIAEYAGMSNPVAEKLRATLQAEGCLTPSGKIAAEKKIASIKKLRELVAVEKECGLKQAKDAIEDYSRFFTFVQKYGFPPMGSMDREFGWIPA